MRWKGPVLALLGAAAVAAIAIALTLRGGGDKTVTGAAGTTSSRAGSRSGGSSTGGTTTTGEGVSIPKPGDVRPGHRLLVATGDGVLELVEVQPEGKTALPAQDWRNGARPQPGERLGA